MNKKITALIIILIIVFFIWILINTDKWIRRKIKKDASSKGIIVANIREPEKVDGQKPFKDFSVFIGFSSHIFGFNGENRYFKIVQTNVGDKFWVQIDTVLFIPKKTKWKKAK